MPRCLECNSAFFKTLEIRVPLDVDCSDASEKRVYYKKRCKRCKHKFFVEKNLNDKTTRYIAHHLWEEGIRVATGYELNNGGFQIMVGEYTRRMSRNPESFNRYMKKMDREKKKTLCLQNKSAVQESIMPKSKAALKNQNKKSGIFPRFLSALKDRYHHVLQVIDEALASDNLKDRIWAVEQILKRTKPEADMEMSEKAFEVSNRLKTKSSQLLDSARISEMTEQELLAAIRDALSERGHDE